MNLHHNFTLTLFAILAGTGTLNRAARAADDADSVKPIKALLVTGGCCHDYTTQKKLLSEGISARAPVEWTIVQEGEINDVTHKISIFNNPDWGQGYDVVMHDECCSGVQDPAFIANVLKPHKEGLPAVVLHCGMHSFRGDGGPKPSSWFEFTGLPTNGHGPQAPIAVSYVDPSHPILKGLENWTTVDEELYNNITGKLLDTAHLLGRGKQGDADVAVIWTNTYNDKAKVFGTTLGHNNETVGDPRYLDLVTRGLLWSVGKLDAQHLKPSN